LISDSAQMAKKPNTKQRKAAKVKATMGEFKDGTLHSGKGGPVVKSRRQAIAIALSQAAKVGKRKKRPRPK
jgi:hypothetical protein